jgi:hypothetical protein
MKCPFKPIQIASFTKTPPNYRKTVSPVAAYIHNIQSPSVVTTVKSNLAHAGNTEENYGS